MGPILVRQIIYTILLTNYELKTLFFGFIKYPIIVADHGITILIFNLWKYIISTDNKTIKFFRKSNVFLMFVR